MGHVRITDAMVALGFERRRQGLSWRASVLGLDMSYGTLRQRWDDQHGGVAHERKVRTGSPTNEERDETVLGIERKETDTEIATR